MSTVPFLRTSRGNVPLTVRIVCFVVGTASEVVTQRGQCDGSIGAILAREKTMDGVLALIPRHPSRVAEASADY